MKNISSIKDSVGKWQEETVWKAENRKRYCGKYPVYDGRSAFMNAVLQIVITPLLNRMMGAEQLGGLLYITGLVAIICPSIGQALNNSRLVVRRDFDVTNGDYDWLLLGFGLIGSIVALFMSGKSLESPLMAAGVFLMFMLTVFRYYGDVEYRLNLNYRRYFIYYF